ncbi:hypothetical protein [Catenuloplanes atrovinosus]|uniref:Uncharacterized protein n=1 Tax=Catenuloplanes atrovinosus TaxID=137266 RepID=A0AAE4C7D4_9ACTN|nr:hypothetical protein [Catenuloplanes atrovinosus]MDR7274421.1 hypothetical protein [Catenuloplanes atrovinosus]
MPPTDLTTPIAAENLALFGPGTPGKAARLNYDVPLPGVYSWDRISEIEMPAEWFTASAAEAGTSLVEMGVVKGSEGRLTAVDRGLLAKYFRAMMPPAARPSLRLVAEVGGEVAPQVQKPPGRTAVTATGDLRGMQERALTLNVPVDVDIERIRVDSYIGKLADKEAALDAAQKRTIVLPAPGIGASVRPIEADPLAPATPRFALVETWELRSFLGDYGLGRTLQTFSLLPGERTTVTTQTWRTDSATREDATSIFDSSDSSAQTRFTSALSNETGAAFQDQGGWAMSVSTSAAAGFNVGVVHGKFDLQTGFAANHQEASQRWSNQVATATAEHAAQVNNSRRQSVESVAAESSAAGSSTTTVREIANTNLRRVLNFVFRELNQTYETYVVLRDIKVAFFNGRPGSAEIVPLADLGRLLRRQLRDDAQLRDRVARWILSACAQRIDYATETKTTLQVGTNPTGVEYDWNPATVDAQGELVFPGDVLQSTVRWRFMPGVRSKAPHAVDGVIMSRTSIVLRTDNLVVEALLGQADALDPYASALQAIDLADRQSQIKARDVETRRTVDALELVAAQAATERIAAWQKLFPDEPEIQVVPVASVETNGKVDP